MNTEKTLEDLQEIAIDSKRFYFKDRVFAKALIYLIERIG